MVKRNAVKAKEKQKIYYDLKARTANLESGDRGLVEILAFDAKHKVADKWSDEVFVVIEQPNPEIPIYVDRRDDSLDGEKLLHSNHLLYLGNSLQNTVENDHSKRDQNQKIGNEQTDEQTQNKTVKSDSGFEIEVKKTEDKKQISVLESKIDNAPDSAEDE